MAVDNASAFPPYDSGTPVRERMGRVIRMVMKGRGVTGRDLARVLDCSEAQVSNRLAGHIAFRADELVAVARLLNVEPGLFFSDPESILRNRWMSESPVQPPYQPYLPGCEPGPKADAYLALVH